MSEIKNGRHVFFLETNKKRFFSPQNRKKTTFDIWRAQYLITRNWSNTNTAHTNQTHAKLKQKLWPSNKFNFWNSYSKSGQKILLAQNNDLDSPLFLVVNKKRALGCISSKSKFYCLQTYKHWNLDFGPPFFFVSNSYNIPYQKHKENYSGKLFLSPGNLTDRLRRT